MITDREYRVVEPNEGEGWIFQSWWKATNDPVNPGEVCHSTEICVDDRHMVAMLMSRIYTFTREADIRDAVDRMFDELDKK